MTGDFPTTTARCVTGGYMDRIIQVRDATTVPVVAQWLQLSPALVVYILVFHLF